MRNTEKTWLWENQQVPYWKGWSRYLARLVKAYRGKYSTLYSWKVRTFCAPHMQSRRRQRDGFRDWREKFKKSRSVSTGKKNSRRNRNRRHRNQPRVVEIR